MRKYQLNHNLLDTWTEKSAWFIGLTCADGYIGKRGNLISFHMKDMELLNYLKEILEYNGPIYKTKTEYMLNVYSSNIKDKLAKLGVKNKKSLTLKMPKIPNKVFYHFIRGYFDGDGSFWINSTAKRTNKKLRAQFIGTESFLTSLLERLNFKGKKLYSAGNVKKVCLAHFDSVKLGNLMYRNENYKSSYKKKIWCNAQLKGK